MAATDTAGTAKGILSGICKGGVRVVAALAVAGGAGAGSKAWGQSEWLPTFMPPVVFESGGSYPYGIAAGDVTGGIGGGPDGYPDLAVANGHYDVNRVLTQAPSATPRALVRIFRNTTNWQNPANGLFPHQDIFEEFNNFAGGLYYAKTVPAEVRFAHMNDDEFLDLIVSASALDPTDPVFHPDLSTWGVYVFVWLPEPENRFELKSHYTTPRPVRGLAVADFDNDGLNDVAVATDLNLHQTFPPVPMDVVYMLRNDPQDAGTLVYGADVLLSLPSADVSGDVVVGDFNRVAFGLPLVDVTSANWVDNNVSVLTNGGSFNFSPVNREAPCGDWHFTDLAVGRFTAGSTRDDLAGIISNTARVQILHSDGRGKFTFDCTEDMLDTYELNPGGEPIFNAFHGITVANINLGTKPDIIVTRPSYPTSQITFMLGKGDGRFQYVAGNPAYHKALDPGTTPRSGMAIQVICADLNQDGLEDIVTTNHDSDSVSILINATVINPGG